MSEPCMYSGCTEKPYYVERGRAGNVLWAKCRTHWDYDRAHPWGYVERVFVDEPKTKQTQHQNLRRVK